MIPPSFVQELLSRLDVVSVVGRHVDLKKAGINHKGLCPFHGEKTPSFIVSPSRQTYHCFGCGAHGNAIGFLMEHVGLGFVDAVHELASEAGLTVPEDERSPEERAREQAARERRLTLVELLEKASAHYRRQLKGDKRAINYLKGRGLTGEIAARFGLGYAADSWRGLASALPHYDDPLLEEGGLVIVQGEGEDARRYDRFRDRIMFPIRNVQGEVIGFGGRVLDRGEPKYLNSPETPVFVKGRELYGLYEARTAVRERGYALVVEGYMDVVALAQLGFPNAVATLGTACTADHVAKLFRFTDTVVFSFDGDAAGRRAAGRALEAALPNATDTRTVRFLFLPPEHDPDSYVRESGAEAFQRCIDEAVPLSRQLTEQARDGAELDSAEARSRMLSNARPLWSTLPEGMLRRQLLSELAEAGGVPVDVLAGMWGAEGRRKSPRDETQASPPRGRGSPRRAAPRTATLLDRAAWLLVCHPELWSSVSHEQHEMLAHQPSPYADFFARLERHLNEHGPGSPEALVQDMAAEDLGPEGPTLLARIADFHANGPDVDPHKDLTILMDQLLLGAIKDEMNLLVESGLAEPEMAERYRELGRRQADLTKRLSASPGS